MVTGELIPRILKYVKKLKADKTFSESKMFQMDTCRCDKKTRLVIVVGAMNNKELGLWCRRGLLAYVYTGVSE